MAEVTKKAKVVVEDEEPEAKPAKVEAKVESVEDYNDIDEALDNLDFDD